MYRGLLRLREGAGEDDGPAQPALVRGGVRLQHGVVAGGEASAAGTTRVLDRSPGEEGAWAGR